MPIKELVAYTWKELTDADAANVSFQNRTGAPLYIAVTTGSTPTDPQDTIKYNGDEGETKALSTLVPGVSSGDRVFAWSEKGGPVWISGD